MLRTEVNIRDDEGEKICFITHIEGASAHDDLGTKAMDGVNLAISQFENEELTALWKSLMGQENHHE